MDDKMSKVTWSTVTIEEENSKEKITVNLPFGKERLLDLFRKAVAICGYSKTVEFEPAITKVYEDYVFIRKEFGYKKVSVMNIDYLEAGRNYCDIHFFDGTRMNVSIPMGEVCEYLSPNQFKRVHRSFTVNMEHIDSYVGNTLVLQGGKEIPIGRDYKDSVEKEFVCIGSRKRVREKNIPKQP